MLEGKMVNLTIIEKKDLPLIAKWVNDIEFIGEYEPQETIEEVEKQYDRTFSSEGKWFFIEKKDGTKIGYITHYLAREQNEIGYGIIHKERDKGYCTEATQMIVDYLFLTKNIVRIQADTNTTNVASQKVLEKAGFTKEGTIRKHYFSSGKWRDSFLHSILREEWKKPKILTNKI